MPLGGVAAKLSDQVGADCNDPRAALASLDHEGTVLEVDIGRAQPDCFPQPQPGAVEHQDQGAQHRGPDEATNVGAGRGQYPKHLVVAEDVGQEDRYFDRCQCVFRHVARRIAATAIETQLSHDAELIGDRDGLAGGDTCAPSGYRVIEHYLAVISPMLPDKAHELIKDKLGAPVGDPHRPLEAQKLLCLVGELVGGYPRHVGTGRETSRSVSVAILT